MCYSVAQEWSTMMDLQKEVLQQLEDFALFLHRPWGAESQGCSNPANHSHEYSHIKGKKWVSLTLDHISRRLSCQTWRFVDTPTELLVTCGHVGRCSLCFAYCGTEIFTDQIFTILFFCSKSTTIRSKMPSVRDTPYAMFINMYPYSITGMYKI